MISKQRFFQGLFQGGLLLVILVTASACSPETLSLIKPAATATLVVPVTGDSPSVTVVDQEYDGKTVLVSEVFSPGPGWIAIHVEQDGRIGPAVAFAAVNDGANKDVLVEIDASQATPVMYAMLHTDAGEVGKYEFPGPDVPVVFNGEMIAPSFKALTHTAGSTTEASVVVRDQEIQNGKVIIEKVVSPGPGWIAIHVTDTEGKPGADIGFVHVNAGENNNVSVTIDASRASAMMYAMLHVDAGEVGTYEFPGPDMPLLVDGQMIAPPLHASVAAVAEITATADRPTATNTPSGAAAVAATATVDAAAPESTATDTGPSAILPEIEVADQPIVDGTLTIPRVFSLGDSWIVIHKQNPDGSMGTMVGFAKVHDGLNTDVVVQVDTRLATPVVYAMLHYDFGTIGTIEFPGADVPVMVRGEMLTPPFNIIANEAADIVIDVSKNETGVKHLIDGQGNTLYLSLNDPTGQSACDEACLELWKPVLVLAGAKLSGGVGVSQDRLGVIVLADGSRQVTYAGAPLYTYVNDKNPGETKGQGIDGNWFLIAP